MVLRRTLCQDDVSVYTRRLDRRSNGQQRAICSRQHRCFATGRSQSTRVLWQLQLRHPQSPKRAYREIS